ncbi:MAG: hypothetical protein IH899_13380, partial [Planctomycetes bacterium]|nr:hypothetical protein [Planctomycetota bacterium]
DEVAWRSRAVELLERISPHATERIAIAFGSVFWSTDDFPDDANTLRLLNIIIENPAVLYVSSVRDLIAHLAKLCKFQQRAVLDVTKGIINNYGKDVGSISTDLHLAGPDLVNIAMTLQRFGETRSEGLALLEDLMRLSVDDAFKILNDIDIRPAASAPQDPTRRRRRRKAR